MVSPAAPDPLENIWLVQEDQKILVASFSSHGFESFQLPPIHQSLVQWMIQLCQGFMDQHQRCLALLLLLDCQSRHWGVGFPSQRASHDASCFLVDARDFPQARPWVRVAGSFQSRLLTTDEPPADAVPAADGLHLVFVSQKESAMLYPFLRLNDEVRSVPISSIAVDDIGQAMKHCLSKVQML